MRGYHIIISVKSEDEIKGAAQTFTPKHIFQRLPPHKPSLNRRDSINQEETKDYRFGPLRVDWMDFERQGDLLGRKPSVSTGKERERRGGSFHSSSMNSVMYSSLILGPLEATFVPTSHNKSGSTNLPDGVVHIFRDSGDKPALEDIPKSASEVLPESEGVGVTLGVLAVPSWMPPADFLAFIGPAAESVAHIRIIRSVFIGYIRDTHQCLISQRLCS